MKFISRAAHTSRDRHRQNVVLFNLGARGTWLLFHVCHLMCPASAASAERPFASGCQAGRVLDWYSANCRLHLVAFSAAAVTLVRTPLAEQIAGTDDILTPIRGQLDLAQHIPGAWLAQFPGAGHVAMLQHIEQVAGWWKRSSWTRQPGMRALAPSLRRQPALLMPRQRGWSCEPCRQVVSTLQRGEACNRTLTSNQLRHEHTGKRSGWRGCKALSEAADAWLNGC